MKTRVINLFVVLVFIIGFFLLINYSDKGVTGFTVTEFEDLEIDEEVDIIITLKDDSAYSEKDNIKTQQDKFVKLNNLELNNDYDNINAIAVSVNKSSFEKIINDENVESITFDQVFKISLSSSKSVIKIDEVWDKLVDGVNLTGVGSVCVLDTGVDYNHENLGNIILGYDFVNDDSDPMDDNGHGTHVSGIIISNNSVNRGIAFGGNVIAVKVMNSGGGGSGSDIIAGIDWCINNKDNYNISVISMSIGSDTLFSEVCDSAYQELTDIINSAVGAGILVVSSSSNNYNAGALSLPACISNVTSVGAVDDGDSIASFSNSASFLDILGPGVSITSTKNGGGFVTFSGTSMATPFVSAAVLIIKQYANLGVDEVYDVLVSTGDEVLDGRNGYTFPRLNVLKALVSLDSYEPVLCFDISDVYDDKEQTLVASAVDTFLDSIWVEVFNNNYSNGYVLNDFLIGEEIDFKFYANDSAGNLVSNSSSFVVLDGTPSLEDVVKLVGAVGKEFNFQITASDPTDDVLEFNDDSNLFNITQEGLISFTPFEVGNYTVNISVNDGKHLVSDDFILEILLNNSAPEIVSYNPNLSVSLNENESLEFSVVVEDLDGGSLDYNWYLNSELVSEVDNYNFVTNYSFSGEYNISIIVSDGIESDSLKWNVIVNDVDLVPVYLGGIENISFNENGNYSLDLLSYFVDLDGDSLSYNMSDNDNLSFVDNILIPTSNFVGSRDVKFYGCDLNNCAESGLVNILVNNVVVCGDGLLEGDEECDVALNNKSCLDFDYDSGNLGCSECKFDYIGCVINTPSGGGSASGGGGTKIDGEEETREVNVEEKSEQVKTEVKASEKKGEDVLTGSGIKEMNPKSSRFRRILDIIKEFFKSIFRWIFDLF